MIDAPQWPQIADPVAPKPDWWSWLADEAPLLILDIETRNDDMARRLARRTSPRSTLHLREVVSVTCLIRTSAQKGDNWSMETFHRDDLDESDLLENVHACVLRNAASGGALITYNGRDHDLPLLRARQVRWWQCDQAALLLYLEGTLPHIDVFDEFTRGGRRFGSLTDACASVGVSLFGPKRLAMDRCEIPLEQEKGETDVIGTAIALFYVAADRARSNVHLAKGLAHLGAFVRARAQTSPHLRALAHNPMLNDACHAWGEGVPPHPSHGKRVRIGTGNTTPNRLG